MSQIQLTLLALFLAILALGLHVTSPGTAFGRLACVVLSLIGMAAVVGFVFVAKTLTK